MLRQDFLSKVGGKQKRAIPIISVELSEIDSKLFIHLFFMPNSFGQNVFWNHHHHALHILTIVKGATSALKGSIPTEVHLVLWKY